MSNKKPTHWRDKIKAARLPETVVPVVLRADLAAEREQLLRQLEAVREVKATSLAGSGTAELEQRITNLTEQMRDSVVEFRLRALPRTRRPGDHRPSFAELKAQHPVREENGELRREDIMAGFVNAETFPDPLVRHSIVDPPLTDEDWEQLELSQGQFDELVNAAWQLNQGKVDIPFSYAASEKTPTSDNG
jgi:hypothetical protein